MDRDNPHDIFQHDGAAHSFDVVIRGYDRSQVHDVVDRLDGELRVALADKDASAAKAAELASHLAAAQGELESLQQKAQSAAAPNFESMGARISHMLQLAEEEANDIRRIAHEEQTRSQAELKATQDEGERVRTEAKADAQRMTEEAQAEARRATEDAQQAATKTVRQAQQQAEQLKERARAAAEQAEVDSKARVAKIEEDFQLAQKARRAEASRVEQERDQSSRRDAQNRIEQAQRKSDEMGSAAELRVTDLDARRAELHARLTDVRKLLSGLPDIGTATGTEPSESPTSSKSSPSNGQATIREVAEAPHSTEKKYQGSGKLEPAPASAPDQEEEKADPPTDAQVRPPPPAAKKPSWPVNAPTQAIQVPRQG